MRKFGLIGKNISYSFSERFFTEKFKKEGITDAKYINYDIEDVSLFSNIIQNNPELVGLNVTIPYKEKIIPYLDSLSNKAEKIGAVNTVKILKDGKLKGYNTDCYGFKKALKPHLTSKHKRALILGTGGASKAIAFTLKTLNIEYQFVSRKPSKKGQLTYNSLTEDIINTHQIIVNCTPLGTHPDVEQFPNIPYKGIGKNHIAFDLIYNPKQTQFLIKSSAQKALTINGLSMLKYQAKKSWRIWNT